MFVRCRVIFIVRIFTSTTTTTPIFTLTRQHSARGILRVLASKRGRGRSLTGMASLFSQSARSGCLTRPVSDPTRLPLHTWPKVRWAEPQMPLRSGLRPEGWELPRLPWACPMEDGQGLARWFRPMRRRVARRRSPSLPRRRCGCLDQRGERRCARGRSVGQFE